MAKNQELDDEIRVYQDMLANEEDTLARLNEEGNSLTDRIEEQDSNMADLDHQLDTLNLKREQHLKANENLAA